MLGEILPARGKVLEVASGSGEHCAYFARHLPELQWQPSDPDRDAIASIGHWCKDLDNIAAPIALDVCSDDWPVERADALVCVNMIHISAWESTLGLMAGAARLLEPGDRLYLYGPFLRDGVETAPSNLAFDRSLRERDPTWGLRQLEAVLEAAGMQGLDLEKVIEMPANNLSVILIRR